MKHGVESEIGPIYNIFAAQFRFEELTVIGAIVSSPTVSVLFLVREIRLEWQSL